MPQKVDITAAFFLSGDVQKAEVKHPKAGEFDRAVRDQVAQTLEDTARRDVAPQSRDQVAAAMTKPWAWFLMPTALPMSRFLGLGRAVPEKQKGRQVLDLAAF